MEQTNDRLIVRALERGRGGEPGGDFTGRVMERIERDAALQNRREDRLLLAGAVMCAVGLVALGVCAFSLFPETSMFASFEEAFGRLGENVGRLDFGGNSLASQGSAGTGNDGFLLSLWCYTAVLFLVLAAAGQLLHRKLSGTAE